MPPRPAKQPDPPAERVLSRYCVGEVVPTSDGVWIRLIDTVAAGSRRSAVKTVVGTREGRWFVCAEGTSEVVTYGPPPDPTPTLVATQSISDVLAEPTQMIIGDEPAADDVADAGTSTVGVTSSSGAAIADYEGEPIPLVDVPVDPSQAREGQPIPLADDEL